MLIFSTMHVALVVWWNGNDLTRIENKTDFGEMYKLRDDRFFLNNPTANLKNANFFITVLDRLENAELSKYWIHSLFMLTVHESFICVMLCWRVASKQHFQISNLKDIDEHQKKKDEVSWNIQIVVLNGIW